METDPKVPQVCGAESFDPVQTGLKCTLDAGHKDGLHYHQPTRAMWGEVLINGELATLITSELKCVNCVPITTRESRP